MAIRVLFRSAATIAVSIFAVAAYEQPSCACPPDVPSSASQAEKPNFAGSWTMDRARSFGLPGNMNQTMTVTQKEGQIDIETKLIQPDNERVQKEDRKSTRQNSSHLVISYAVFCLK